MERAGPSVPREGLKFPSRQLDHLSLLPRRPRVVIDACCLYPQYLRDFLLTSATLSLLAPYWSNRILDEFTRNLIENHPQDPDRRKRVAYLREKIEEAFPRAIVAGSVWEPHVADMTNHPKDRHVLAVAVGAGVPFIVTENLHDFPDSAVQPWGIKVFHPDIFLVNLLYRHGDKLVSVIDDMCSRYVRPPMTRFEVLERIGTKAPSFARLLGDWLAQQESELRS